MLKIKNWSSYQSYKDRKPPWIRLQHSLLDNFEFQTMSAAARALLPMLWLLASEDPDPVSGLIRDSYEKIAFRLRQNVKEITTSINEIIACEFIYIIQDCNETVTKSYPIRNETVTPETETETETEKKDPPPPLPDWLPEKDFNDWVKARKRKPTQRAIELNIAILEKLKKEGHDPALVLQQSIRNGWDGLFPIKPENRIHQKPTETRANVGVS